MENSDQENPLRQQDHQPLEQGRLGDLDERHQVHPLVLGFFHQRADPALVILHPPQASCRWVNIAPTMPGTAATVSSTIARWP